MRKALLLVWMLPVVLVGLYHAGPGQAKVVLDEVGDLLDQAKQYVAEKNWPKAEEKYEAALVLLPDERVDESRRIRLERAKVQMLNEKLPTAHLDLEALVDELKGDKDADPELFAESQAALANSQYYLTWLMRLEGRPKDVWEPEIEASRQTFRLLAERALEASDAENAKRYREDLESSIRLARMDLSDLQGLPLPSQ